VAADPGLSTTETFTATSYKIVVVPASYAAIRSAANVTPQRSLGSSDTVAIPWKSASIGPVMSLETPGRLLHPNRVASVS
jgi:hypothetical protein